jgi:hypothetical protein
MPTTCALEGCAKRVPVSNMPCRCGQRFCNAHRYPETHPCTHDFKRGVSGEDAAACAERMRCVAAKVEKV